jgi:pimeloyl-ACP methyl ester carboxylesterase
MGGATALRFAARWPERVEGLVLASTMASRLPEAFIERAKVVERVLERGGLPEAFRFYFNGPLFRGVPREERFEAQVEAWASAATRQGFLGCYRVTIDRPSMTADLDRIQAPTLILVGERDTFYHEDAELMARRIPGARKLVIGGAGHALSVESPEVFADEVLGFFDSLPRGPVGEPEGTR